MNPDFDTIGKTFVQAYYARFDQKHTRPEVVQFYIVSNIPWSFAGFSFT